MAVALHARVVCANIVERLRIDDVLSRWMSYVVAPGSMTLFTSNIPLRDLLRFNVVINRMATITSWPSGTVKVRWAVERDPPIGARFHMIWKPAPLLYVPLGRQRVVVVTPFGEIPLLESAPVNKCHLIESKSADQYLFQ